MKSSSSNRVRHVPGPIPVIWASDPVSGLREKWQALCGAGFETIDRFTFGSQQSPAYS